MATRCTSCAGRQETVSKVQIPVVLRAASGGEKIVEASGSTLGELLRNLYAQYPELGARLGVTEGLSTYVNFYVNGEDARTLEGAETTVASSDTVTILPAMAGG